MGDVSSFIWEDLQPKLSHIRLRFGIRCPVITTVFILAANLTIVTTATAINIY